MLSRHNLINLVSLKITRIIIKKSLRKNVFLKRNRKKNKRRVELKNKAAKKNKNLLETMKLEKK